MNFIGSLFIEVLVGCSFHVIILTLKFVVKEISGIPAAAAHFLRKEVGGLSISEGAGVPLCLSRVSKIINEGSLCRLE